MFSLKRILFLFSVLLVSVSLYAQEAANYGESELIITAGRIPEEADSVPAQVTVITAEDIAESGAVSVTAVLETVAGVRFSGAMAGPGSEMISMRGFGENSYGRVLVLVDGRKLNDPDMKAANWNAIPLGDIERIEVLDGSASIQYGNNAVGGVINIITKKSGSRRTAMELAGGSFLYNREALSHFEPLSWGNFSLSAEHSGTDGYRERQRAQTTNVNGSAVWYITDTLLLSANAFFSGLYYQLPGGLTKVEFEDDPTQASSFDDENTEYHFGGGMGLEWTPLENLELSLPLSYAGKIIKSDMVTSWGSTYSNRTVHTAETRPQGAFTFDISGMKLRLLGGVDVYFARLTIDNFSDKARHSKTGGHVITEWTAGPYATVRFDPSPFLSLFAGARFDTAFVTGESSTSSFDENKHYSAFVYEAGIVIKSLTGVKLYAKYSTLFRYPFVDELILADTSTPALQINDLDPERGFNLEAGVAYKFKDMLNISWNFFYMQLKDEIAFVGNSTPPFWGTNVNLDKTRRGGINITLEVKPLELISLTGSYSFVNAVFADGPNDGNRIPMVPAHKIYGNLLVNLSQYAPFGISFGPNIEYISDAYYGGDNANIGDTLDAYVLLGAKARFILDRESKQLALQVTANNLLDTHYGLGYWGSIYPSDGRSFTVSLHYKF